MTARGKLGAFDIGYTDDGCTLTIEWHERLDMESAMSAANLSARSVDLVRRILEAALAAVTKAIEDGDVTEARFGDPP